MLARLSPKYFTWINSNLTTDLWGTVNTPKVLRRRKFQQFTQGRTVSSNAWIPFQLWRQSWLLGTAILPLV